MNLGIPKKVIFSLFLFISFVEPGNTSEVNKISKDLVASQSSPKISKNKKLPNSSFNQNSEKLVLSENFSENNSEQQLIDIDEKRILVVNSKYKNYDWEKIVYDKIKN